VQLGSPPLPETGEGNWRPGARWAKDSDAWLERSITHKHAKRAAIQAEIEALPLHQRPPVRELGRRSESMPHPFRPMPRDEAAPPAGAYDLQGAFWQQGRTLGGFVARAVGSEAGKPRHPGGSRDPSTCKPEVGEGIVARPTTSVVLGPGLRRDDDDCSPLVTTHRVGSRVLLAAACPVAQALGLSPGMPLTQARALVPGLDVRPADPDGEATDLQRLAAHAAWHWTPQAAVAPGEGLWLDIGASAHLFGGEEGFARHVLGLCRRLGLTARIAVADSVAAAHALARCASAPLTLCPPGGDAELIADLPLSALRLDPSAVDAAKRLGIDTVGALAALPRAPLARRLGNALVQRLDQTLGRRGEPLTPVTVAETPLAELRFAEPILTAEAIEQILASLTEKLGAALAERRLGARLLALTLTRIDAAHQRIAVGLAGPSRDPTHLRRLLAMRIETVEPGFGIEAMTLAAERVEPLDPVPLAAPFGGRDAPAELAELIDRLATRLGPHRLYRAAPVESDVPERSVGRVAPTEAAAAGRWDPRWPRPVRIFHRAERVEGVMALLPDGIPKRFTWRGRSYLVLRGDGPERIHGEWWRRPSERDAVRDYFQVEDSKGARFWLFRRGDALDEGTGDLSWHLHGLFA